MTATTKDRRNFLQLQRSASVLDGAWHYLAIERGRSDGQLWMFIDGVLVAEADGSDGDISYPDDGVPTDKFAEGRASRVIRSS